MANLGVRGLGDRTIIVWDVATGGQRLRLATPPGAVVSLAYSRDGSLIVSASAYESSFRIWDPVRGCVVRHLESRVATRDGIALAPDGRLVATADADRTVKLWSFETGERLAPRWGDSLGPKCRLLARRSESHCGRQRR